MNIRTKAHTVKLPWRAPASLEIPAGLPVVEVEPHSLALPYLAAMPLIGAWDAEHRFIWINPDNTEPYAHMPDRCPTNHYNDGTDFCRDCGQDLQR